MRSFRPRLAQAALHHVSRTQLFTHRPNIDRFAGVSQRRAAGDDTEIRESRQPGHNVLGETLGQHPKIVIPSAEFEGQHRNPETFVRSLLARNVADG